MNILLVAGLLILSESLYVYSEDDLPVSSTKDSSSAHLDTQFNTDTDILTDSSHKGGCRLCKKMIVRFERVIDKSQSPERVQKQFFNICGIFNANAKRQCIKFFNGPGLKAIKAILKSENPKKVCQIMDACVQSESYSQYLEIFDLYFQTERLDKKSLKSCKVCQTVVEVFERDINSSKTSGEVQNVLFGFCGIFNILERRFCVIFFKTNGLVVIEGILKKKDSIKICQLMSYCRDRATEEKSTNSIEEFSEKANSLVDRDEALKTINSICSVLDSPLRDACMEIVTLKILMKSGHLEDLYEVFADYNIETNDSPETNILPQDNVENPIGCFLCKKVMTKVIKILGHGRTEEKIRKAFGKVCKLFKGKLRKKCKRFVDKYSHKLIKYLLKKYTPKMLCKVIGLCSINLPDENVDILEIVLNDDSSDKEINNIEESEINKDGIL